MKKEDISLAFQTIQDSICDSLEAADERGKFSQDKWEHTEGSGGGITRVMSNGKVIEKGGVNFSAVSGKTPKAVLSALELDLESSEDFFATGVSIVLHPYSPMVPIIHMNIRYFELGEKTWWFGGGIDLTPIYVNAEDARYFHSHLKNVCDKHHPRYYYDFKQRADEYFYIKHRKETRGIGGIFFDHLKDDAGFTKASRFEFVKDVGLIFAPIYTELIRRNKNLPFTEAEKNWQYIRRGRYAEFNLVYDRGTKFGLETGGRIESILMSLPPQANWVYDYKPAQDSEEEKTLNLLKKGINWI